LLLLLLSSRGGAADTLFSTLKDPSVRAQCSMIRGYVKVFIYTWLHALLSVLFVVSVQFLAHVSMVTRSVHDVFEWLLAGATGLSPRSGRISFMDSC